MFCESDMFTFRYFYHWIFKLISRRDLEIQTKKTSQIQNTFLEILKSELREINTQINS